MNYTKLKLMVQLFTRAHKEIAVLAKCLDKLLVVCIRGLGIVRNFFTLYWKDSVFSRDLGIEWRVRELLEDFEIAE